MSAGSKIEALRRRRHFLKKRVEQSWVRGGSHELRDGDKRELCALDWAIQTLEGLYPAEGAQTRATANGATGPEQPRD